MVAFDDVHILAKVIDGDMNAQEPFCLPFFEITIHLILVLDDLFDRPWIPSVMETVL